MADRPDIDRLAADVRQARRDIAASLIAVKGHLDTPYPDDERWTPWTRFVERALRDLDSLVTALDELVALARAAVEGGPGTPDECPAGHGDQCCRWPDECRAALSAAGRTEPRDG